MSRPLTQLFKQPASPLIASDEAFQYYTLALIRSGQNGDVDKAVKLREKLLKAEAMATLSTEATNARADSSQPSSPSANAEASLDQTVPSRSQQIAQSAIAAVQSSLPPPIHSSAYPPLSGNPLIGGGAGTLNSPIFVSVAECEDQLSSEESFIF